MTSETIDTFVTARIRKETKINIHFKDRGTVTGLFIRCADYDELKLKNFWRVVSSQNVQLWLKTQNMELARVFNGAAFTRLSEEES